MTTYNVYRDDVLIASNLTSPSYIDTGLTNDVEYSYQVSAVNEAGEGPKSSAVLVTPTASVEEPPPVSASVFGPGVGYETKANERIDGTNKQAFGFVADHTGSIESFALNQRGGTGYSLGNGGTLRVTLQSNTSGHPSGSVLATKTFSPGNPAGNWEVKTRYTFDAPYDVTEGDYLWLVMENTHASPAANYISVNLVLAWGTPDTPRQPAFPDTFAVMRNTGSWSLQSGYLAVFDVEWDDNHHQGNMYFAVILSEYGLVSGPSKMVRHRFTVGGGTRIVDGVWIQASRQTGSADLVVTLQTGGGTLVEAVNVAASSFPVRAADTEFGAVPWVWVPFVTPRTLTNGSGYSILLSCAAGTQYSVMPLRSTDDAMLAAGWGGWHFPYGASSNGSSTEDTTNSGASWAALYPFARVDGPYYFEEAA